MGRKEAAKQDAKELLLAEMVYKAAVEKHRQEQSEIDWSSVDVGDFDPDAE